MSEDDIKHLYQIVLASIFSYQIGANTKESELGKLIAADDSLWLKFLNNLGGDEQ